MTWQPGTPIQTTQDEADWLEWKRIRKVVAQRKRRSQYRRIDYIEVSDAAASIIDRECEQARRERRYIESSYSAVLNMIVTEWESLHEIMVQLDEHRNNMPQKQVVSSKKVRLAPEYSATK